MPGLVLSENSLRREITVEEGSGTEQCRRELTPFAQGQGFGRRSEYLNTDVVGAGRLVRANSIANRVQIAPGDDGVDEPVASAVREVAFVKAEPQKIVGVVGQREIEGEKRTRDLPRPGGIGFEHNCLLGTQVTVWA